MSYRLLLDLEVYDFLAALTAKERGQLRRRFQELQEAPGAWQEIETRDSNGRLLWMSICGRFAITFWEDFPDRQIKVLRITLADR